MVSLSILSFYLLLLLPALSLAQTGTTTVNISSDSTQMSYVSTWRSDTATNLPGAPGDVYEAYSNASDASAVFTFKGVKVSYVGQAKADRGLFTLTLNGAQAYTVDLYDDSGYAQPLKVWWTSPLLPYGTYTVKMNQIGIDARFGFYPYLYTSTWIETVPTNVASYTATEVITTTYPTPTSSASTPIAAKKHTSVAPIIGGVVGGVIALGLVGFLVYLWRKDRASSARGGGGVEKVKRYKEGGNGAKMVIEDDPPALSPSSGLSSSHAGGLGGGPGRMQAGSEGGGYGYLDSSEGGYSAGHPATHQVYEPYGGGRQHSPISYGGQSPTSYGSGQPYPPSMPAPVSLAGGSDQPYYDYHERRVSPVASSPPAGGGLQYRQYGPPPTEGSVGERDRRLYPYHESQPVPEI